MSDLRHRIGTFRAPRSDGWVEKSAPSRFLPSPHPATRRIEKTSQSTDEFPPPRRLYRVRAQNKEMGAMMLKNKVAVVYGSSGAVGSAIAGAFAREGARVFLTGRNLSKVDTVAKGIMDAGGRAEAAQVDALDER